MNKCTIFAGGEPVSIDCIDFDFVNSSYKIAADKGYKLACNLGVVPDIAMGDFDSLNYLPDGVETEKYPTQKDDTDLMLAVKKGLSKGCTDFIVYGALGGRFDHLIGNVQTLAYLLSEGARGKIVSENENINLVAAGKYRVPQKEGFSLSLTAYSPTVTNLTIKGAEYTTENAEITNSFPIGISNVITDDFAEISFSSGQLLIIQSRLITDF